MDLPRVFGGWCRVAWPDREAGLPRRCANVSTIRRLRTPVWPRGTNRNAPSPPARRPQPARPSSARHTRDRRPRGGARLRPRRHGAGGARHDSGPRRRRAAAAPFPAPPSRSATSRPASSRRRRRNEEGSYRVPFLIPGNYTVTVSLAGFSKFVSEPDRGARRGPAHRRRDAEGRRRSPTRSRSRAVAATIDRTTAELGQVVDARRIAELPIREGQPRRAGDSRAGRDGHDRPAFAQGGVQQRPVAVLDRRRRREEERLHDRRRLERRQRSRGLQPAVGVGRGVQDPHDVVRRRDRQHDGRGREPRHQERHQRAPRAGLRVVSRRHASTRATTSTSAPAGRSATTRTIGSAPPSAGRSGRIGRSTSPTSRRTRSRSPRRTS